MGPEERTMSPRDEAEGGADARAAGSMKDAPPQYYGDYLQVDKLLDAQRPVSRVRGQEAHDEMLFIVVHQVHELWFRQILHELDSVVGMFQRDVVDERSIGVAVARLERIIEIQKECINTIRVLETMTSLDFLDFRDLLNPASGFQSVQFRMIENRLGLHPEQRLRYNKAPYLERFNAKDREILAATEKGPTLFDLIEAWLERTPFLEYERFDFMEAYEEAVDRMLAADREIIEHNPTLSPGHKKAELEQLEKTRAEFDLLFDKDAYEKARAEGKKRFSYRATLAALLINLYRDEPILHLPFRFLERLLDVDEHFTMWRHRHAIMVHRMIGAKIGTGGSSGHDYLRALVEAHRIFTDLFDLSTYLIPRSQRPPLPDSLKRELGFYYTEADRKDRGQGTA